MAETCDTQGHLTNNPNKVLKIQVSKVYLKYDRF